MSRRETKIRNRETWARLEAERQQQLEDAGLAYRYPDCPFCWNKDKKQVPSIWQRDKECCFRCDVCGNEWNVIA